MKSKDLSLYHIGSRVSCSTGYLRLAVCAVLALGHFMCLAGVTSIPDSVQPGAQRPAISESEDRPSTQTEEVIDIPSVIERPLAIDEGEKILVNRFALINAADMPELGIRKQQVEQFVESLRQQRPQGFTVGRLQEVANALTRFYRAKGLALAQAVIPIQDVEAGVVKIEIFIGYLDRVLVEGNQIYDAAILKAVFNDLINQPIIKEEIEAALLRLTDYPGLQIVGVFQPGQLIGTADIVLNVQSEERFRSNVRFDNQGNRETGRLRSRLSFDVNHVLKGPDQLGFLVQQSFSPKESTFYYVDYERYLPFGLLFRSSISVSDYGVGEQFAAQEITGGFNDVGIFLEKSIIRSRTENLSAAVSFNRSDSEIEQFGSLSSREINSVINVAASYDVIDSFDVIAFLRPEESEFESRSINFFNFRVSQGLEDVFGSLGSVADVANQPVNEQPNRLSGSGEPVSGDYTRFFLSYNRFQNLTNTHSFLLRTEFQWSDDLLLSQQQYAIGGPNNVRAFSPAVELVDQASFLSLEYFFNTPWFAQQPVFENYTLQELLQFSVFYDLALGKINDPGPFDEVGWKSYQGVGVGAQFSLPGQFNSKLVFAWPLGVGDTAEFDTGNGREPQIWLDVTFSF